MSARALRRTLAAMAVLAVLALVVPPSVTLNRYRATLTKALSEATGRPVSVGSINLRLLPQPGFDLTDFVMQDDPAFSAEPMLRAEEVTAGLRLASLWRGRLEIARLDLRYPSLNLVRDARGRWNLAQLLERGARQPSAPTGETRPGASPRFPYIAAEDGRINWKVGQEKKVFSLEQADFSLWLDRPDEWAMRLEASPTRTDVSIQDAGSLKLRGRFRRAPTPGETPFRLEAWLQDLQLGQLTRLLYARDRGWRGEVAGRAVLEGTPAEMQLTADLTVSGFRRYDIVTGESVRLWTHCTSVYRAEGERLSALACRMPSGEGEIRLEGEIAALFRQPRPELQLTADQVPLAGLLPLLRQMKEGVPPDLAASGTVQAEFSFTPGPGGQLAWDGSATTVAFSLSHPALAKPLELGALELAVHADKQGRWLRLEPAPLDLGGAGPATLHAWFSSSSYRLEVVGRAELSRVLALTQIAGLPVVRPDARGSAKVDAVLAGSWAEFATPTLTGTAQLRQVEADVPGIAGTLLIQSGNVVVSAEEVRASNLLVGFANSQLQVQGSVRMPRRCESPAACQGEFALYARSVSLEELNRLFNPQLEGSRWFAFRRTPPESALRDLNVRGSVAIGRLLAGSLLATDLRSEAHLNDGRLQLLRLRAGLLGGTHQGEWNADFTMPQPVYVGSGTLTNIAMDKVARLTGEAWAAGRLRGNYRLALKGSTAEELRASAAGSLEFDWKDGMLARLALSGSGPLRFSRLSGNARLSEGSLAFFDSQLMTQQGAYTLTGTASLRRELDLRLVREPAHTGSDSRRIYTVKGTLLEPQVEAEGAAETRAALEP